jgi:hypothetical protein
MVTLFDYLPTMFTKQESKGSSLPLAFDRESVPQKNAPDKPVIFTLYQ